MSPAPPTDRGAGRRRAWPDDNWPMAVGQAEALGQLNALCERLRERVPFYRERLPEKPIRSLDEFATLPFTTKADFRDNYPFGLFAVPLNQVMRLHMSSGTTGKPVITGYTKHDLDLWGECMERVLQAGDVANEDVLQNAYGYGLFTRGIGLHHCARPV